MVAIKRQLVASRAKTSAGTNGRKYIMIHETANTSRGANAQAHADLQSRGFSASWHWQVDDKEAIQSYPHSVRCWHGGDGKGPGNFESIGVEICVNSDGDFRKALANAVELVCEIMADEGIPITNVKQHNFFSGKNCPTNLRNGSKGVNWADFIAKIKADDTQEVVQVSKPTVKPAPTPVKPTPKPSSTRALRYGDKGPEVREMQRLLAKAYFYPEKGAKNHGVDGYFGRKTENALKRFQSVYTPHEVDGYYGVKTKAALTRM